MQALGTTQQSAPQIAQERSGADIQQQGVYVNTDSEPRRAVPQVQTSLLQDAENKAENLEWIAGILGMIIFAALVVILKLALS